MNDLILASEAGRVLKLSAASVRKLAIEGRLPYTRTANGTRLFQRQDVEALAAARESE